MKTVLYDFYPANARFIDFYGWELPVWFSSIESEHKAVRSDAGVFDISHMKRTRFSGEGAGEFLDYLCTAPVSRAKPGKLVYTYMLNEKGGIIDDGIVFKFDEESYLFVTNACTSERVESWFREAERKLGKKVEIQKDEESRGMIAVQGPRALDRLNHVSGLDIGGLKRFEMIRGNGWVASRSGYTGEDGAEVIAGQEFLVKLFKSLVDAGVKPCGLGARDTLRLEMGYPLGCVDTNESVSPVELGGSRYLD
ncbi:MAG: glycine cleavage system aminomethyltransferase GcvT, partial [Thermoprotei archaeon]